MNFEKKINFHIVSKLKNLATLLLSLILNTFIAMAQANVQILYQFVEANWGAIIFERGGARWRQDGSEGGGRDGLLG